MKRKMRREYENNKISFRIFLQESPCAASPHQLSEPLDTSRGSPATFHLLTRLGQVFGHPPVTIEYNILLNLINLFVFTEKLHLPIIYIHFYYIFNKVYF